LTNSQNIFSNLVNLLKYCQIGLEGVMQLLKTFKIPSALIATQMMSQSSSVSMLSQSTENIRYNQYSAPRKTTHL
jgi:hypothetical protein